MFVQTSGGERDGAFEKLTPISIEDAFKKHRSLDGVRICNSEHTDHSTFEF